MVVFVALALAAAAGGAPGGERRKWVEQVLAVPYAVPEPPPGPVLQLMRQDFEALERGRSILKTPLAIGTRRFEHGLGTHAVSHIRVYSPQPIERFSAWVGVDHNERTEGGAGSVTLTVASRGRELFRSGVLRGGQEPERVDVAAAGARVLDLYAGDGGDGPACDHADWADATLALAGGKTMRLDEIPEGAIPATSTRYPFSFVYGGKPSDTLLGDWKREAEAPKPAPGREQSVTTWTDPATGLRLRWEATRFADFPAVEWVLWFENTGNADTPILENVQALDVLLEGALSREASFRLHGTNGAPSDPTDFEPKVVPLRGGDTQVMGGGGGRSSNKDFPFFKVETGRGSFVVAVGWSGQWAATAECLSAEQLRVAAGLERTHFRLRPGERVRSPRVLVLHWEGDTLGNSPEVQAPDARPEPLPAGHRDAHPARTSAASSLEANAQFRQLIYKHYAAVHTGKKPLPMLFLNTCFTRGGGWLNECNAENQIPLIRAFAPMGLEALLTDAGWFEGGWPAGAGNWNPRKDAYPQGMGPVAAAAKEHGMVYGLWFEPERVVAGTAIHREHPEWCLPAGPDPQGTYLLDFGRPEVQSYFFNIVKGFMELPGFRFYRQDFNMDPLPFWRYNEPEDRQGITEMKYVEGLYAYWDRIAATWPDSTREECASGGRRIDLETVMRMHLHQDSDYWFDNEVDQGQIWGLSQYLPNNLFVGHLNRLDDYSFHSTMASSLCPGWIADAPGFDTQRGKKLLERYRAVRHLLTGAWYPLLPYSRRQTDWMASQYHRPELDEGMILAFRRPESPYRAVDVRLHGLKPDATYELSFDIAGTKTRAKGAALMAGMTLTLPEAHRSELILYRRLRE